MGEIGGYDVLFTSGYLGHGSYGSVFKAKNKETGDLAAMKRIIIPTHDKRKLEVAHNEIRLLKELGDQHQNILKLIKAQEDADGPNLYISILTEYCIFKDLEDYSYQYYLTTGHRLKIMQETASGLAFMHRQDPPLIHRDIKPSNILMTEENGQHVVRLADFGLARPLLGSKSAVTMTNLGTEVYMAPEQFDESDHWPKMEARFSMSGAQDAYSFGILSYQLVTSDPWKGIECPDVTATSIGRMMMRWKEKSWLAKKVNSKPAQCDPIIIKDSDSEIVKATKQVIKSVVKFDPRQRSDMADVEKRLTEIINSAKPSSLPPPQTRQDILQSKHVPVMTKLASYKLPFTASNKMDMNSGRVILEDKDNDKLVLSVLTEDGYNTLWQKPRPHGVKPHSRVYFLNDGNIVFRHDDDNVTVVCDGDLNPIHTHTGDYGELCGVVQGKHLLYRKQSGDHVLDLYDSASHQHVCRLPVSVKSDDICTASHPATGWFVLTDPRSATMYMFTSDYQLHKQVRLGSLPLSTNAVCCVRNLIAVVRWGMLGGEIIVYFNWAGEEVKWVMEEEMGVEGEIWGVCDGGEGRIQVCTGDRIIWSKGMVWWSQADIYVFKI